LLLVLRRTLEFVNRAHDAVLDECAMEVDQRAPGEAMAAACGPFRAGSSRE
jgi:hypothetical protein